MFIVCSLIHVPCLHCCFFFRPSYSVHVSCLSSALRACYFVSVIIRYIHPTLIIIIVIILQHLVFKVSECSGSQRSWGSGGHLAEVHVINGTVTTYTTNSLPWLSQSRMYLMHGQSPCVTFNVPLPAPPNTPTHLPTSHPRILSVSPRRRLCPVSRSLTRSYCRMCLVLSVIAQIHVKCPLVTCCVLQSAVVPTALGDNGPPAPILFLRQV